MVRVKSELGLDQSLVDGQLKIEFGLAIRRFEFWRFDAEEKSQYF